MLPKTTPTTSQFQISGVMALCPVVYPSFEQFQPQVLGQHVGLVEPKGRFTPYESTYGCFSVFRYRSMRGLLHCS